MRPQVNGGKITDKIVLDNIKECLQTIMRLRASQPTKRPSFNLFGSRGKPNEKPTKQVLLDTLMGACERETGSLSRITTGTRRVEVVGAGHLLPCLLC